MIHFKNKKILITGHTGFKGGWLSVWLERLGAKVFGFSLDPPSSPSLFHTLNLSDRFPWIKQDVQNLPALQKAVADLKPDLIFHLAAQALVRQAYETPIQTYATNVMGTANLLQAVRSVKMVKGVIVVTSDKCYENTESINGYTENDRLGGNEPYASSKACAELVTTAFQQTYFPLNTYGRHHETLIATVRAGNVLGGGDWGHYRLVPDCIRAFQAGNELVLRYPRAIRPWQYILDLLYGYLRVGKQLLNKDTAAARSWNFSPDTGEENVTVEDLVQKVHCFFDKGSVVVKPTDGPKETGLLRLDSSLARKKLGWRSRICFDDCLLKTLAWYQNFYNGLCLEKLFDYTLAELAAYEAQIEGEQWA